MLAAIVNRLWAMSIRDHNERDAEGNTRLMYYAAQGDTEKVEPLLYAGAGRAINAKNPKGYTALSWAAIYNHAGTIQSLLRAGANINAQDLCGNTALSLAVFYGQTQAVWALLYAGADINIPQTCVTQRLCTWLHLRGELTLCDSC